VKYFLTLAVNISLGLQRSVLTIVALSNVFIFSRQNVVSELKPQIKSSDIIHEVGGRICKNFMGRDKFIRKVVD